MSTPRDRSPARVRGGGAVRVATLVIAATLAVASCGGGGDQPTEFASVPAASPNRSALQGSDDGKGHASGGPVGAGGTAPNASADGKVTCPTGGGTTVHNADELTAALKAARPGTIVRMAAGRYVGDLGITVSGTEASPIWLCGSPDAVIDGEDDAKYLLYLNKVSWVRVVGFSLRGGRKGLVADSVHNSIIASLHVSQIGDEAIHLRTASTDNTVIGNVIRDTGNRSEKFGEGIYVGSATSNWCTYTDCQPDRSNRNSVIGNDIADTTSENIDIKEGTEGGVVRDNRLSGSGMVATDSWIDVKGNGWLVENNTGTTDGGSIEDGIQTHVVEEGWGRQNTIRGNQLTVDGEGYGVYIHDGKGTLNVVGCDNKVTGAKKGLSNIPCSSG
ncbi:hypothetical protein [Pseudofrankia asymbiotica]|uniref:Right handed beta helix domain-containing protein n=1 Tax=Pseudofrankia asymbiotica TaxID=1834516 RepID=A0A1V2I6H6_9ACTN|nr:hypothetical protein [Pseudofrankia asymbiotica]ONH26822.1 hypothetical protein BL253_23840 [Pseudofrankia asymbiotica]